MVTISLEALDTIVGGADATAKWNEIRASAKRHCPLTVARYTDPPDNRAEAQRIGNACLREMGPLKAMVGRKRIRAGIDAAFPPE